MSRKLVIGIVVAVIALAVLATMFLPPSEEGEGGLVHAVKLTIRYTDGTTRVIQPPRSLFDQIFGSIFSSFATLYDSQAGKYVDSISVEYMVKVRVEGVPDLSYIQSASYNLTILSSENINYAFELETAQLWPKGHAIFYQYYWEPPNWVWTEAYKEDIVVSGNFPINMLNSGQFVTLYSDTVTAAEIVNLLSTTNIDSTQNPKVRIYWMFTNDGVTVSVTTTDGDVASASPQNTLIGYVDVQYVKPVLIIEAADVNPTVTYLP